MKFTNINSGTMKKINLRFVLDSIRKNEPISRKELADKIGLTSSSITNIVNRLIGEGYLVETGSGESMGGRKPVMLGLNAKARYAVGVELAATVMVCIITDFKAMKIKRNECPTNIHEGKDKVLERVIDLINRTIEEAAIPRDKIMGIGLVSAGPYDHEKGIMVNPPNFPGWYNVPIRDIIQEATGIPTYFEKETVGAAMAECWFGSAADMKSLFMVMVYDVGIGGAVIIDGQIYHGFCNGAGDLGHMVIDIEGPACSCGNYGCLETVASGMAIVRNVKSEIKHGEESVLKSSVSDIEQMDTEMVIKASDAGDALSTRMIEKSARYMGIALANLINVYSPEMIVIGGQVCDICSHYTETATTYARKRTYPLYNKDVKILPSTFGPDQCAIGGVGMVFQEFFKKFEV